MSVEKSFVLLDTDQATTPGLLSRDKLETLGVE
jgi:hypothetical protein